jgi:hypothetical protein
MIVPTVLQGCPLPQERLSNILLQGSGTSACKSDCLSCPIRCTKLCNLGSYPPEMHCRKISYSCHKWNSSRHDFYMQYGKARQERRYIVDRFPFPEAHLASFRLKTPAGKHNRRLSEAAEMAAALDKGGFQAGADRWARHREPVAPCQVAT